MRKLIASAVRHFWTAFAAIAIPGLTGAWYAHSWSEGKALAWAAVTGGISAGVRAVYGALRKGELPFPNVGL